MTPSNDFVVRLDRLESRAAIAALATRYALACDEHDMPALLALFTDDAEICSPSGLMQASGKAAIEAMFDRMLSIRGPAYHWTHDHLIDMDPADPDRATGLLLGHAETTPGGVASIAALRYHDVYRRQLGQWRIARREVQFLYYVPLSEYPQALNRPDRLVAGDRRLPADFPETLPAWQAFARRHGNYPRS